MDPAFRMESTHGLVVGVRATDVDPAVDVHAEEEACALGFGPPRRRTFAAGRSALRLALRSRSVEAGAILRDVRGAPILPAGWVGSISHKERVAVALVREDDGARVGVDVELPRELSVDISGRILTDEESAFAAKLDARERGAFVLRRFSMKEAIYKAIDPFLRRYVGFREVAIREEAGSCVVVSHLRPDEPRLRIEVESVDVGDGALIVSTARASLLG